MKKAPKQAAKEKPAREPGRADPANYILVWTGPRMSDIQDCEDKLFSGSITLFGDDAIRVPREHAALPADEQISLILKGGPGEGSFNISFCNSLYAPSKRMRINHNKTTAAQDLFTLTQQLRLLFLEKKAGRGDRVRFMSYNPNFVPSTGREAAFGLLDAILSGESGVRKLLENRVIQVLRNVHVSAVNGTRTAVIGWVGVNGNMRKNVPAVDMETGEVLADDETLAGAGISDEFRAEAKFLKDAAEATGCLADGRLDPAALAGLISSRTLCLNRPKPGDKRRHPSEWLGNKDEFRRYCRRIGVPATESITVTGTPAEASLAALRSHVSGARFVVQRKNSSGGYGTFVFRDPSDDPELDEGQKAEMTRKVNNALYNIMVLRSDDIDYSDRGRETVPEGDPDLFVLSRYRSPNIPVNVHAIIGKDEIIMTKCSVQVIDSSGGKLIYSGADFVAFRKYAETNPGVVRQMDTYLSWVCKSLQSDGYRGIIGFDMIIGDRIEFVEANDRFQASTILLNRALSDAKYLRDRDGLVKTRVDGRRIVVRERKPSMQMLNLFAFPGEDDRGPSRVAKALYDRCYVNHEYHNVINSRSGGMNDFPIPDQELRSAEVPYSCYIYYKSAPAGTVGPGVQYPEHQSFIHDAVVNVRNEDATRRRIDAIRAEIRTYKKAVADLHLDEAVAGKPGLSADIAAFTGPFGEERTVTERDARDRIDAQFKTRMGDLRGKGLKEIRTLLLSATAKVLDTVRTETSVVPEGIVGKVPDHRRLFVTGGKVRGRRAVETALPEGFVEAVWETVSEFPKEMHGLFKDVSTHCSRAINSLWTLGKVQEEMSIQYSEDDLPGIRGCLARVARLPDAEDDSALVNGAIERISELLATVYTSRDVIRTGVVRKDLALLKCLQDWHVGKLDAGGEDAWKALYRLAIDESPSLPPSVDFFDADLSGRIDGAYRSFEKDAYLYKLVFDENLSSVRFGHLVINPSLPVPTPGWSERITSAESRDMAALKVGLLNNGVRLQGFAPSRSACEKGKLDILVDCPYEFTSGLDYFSSLPVSAPFWNRISRLSPFSVLRQGDETYLQYYDTPLRTLEVSDIDAGEAGKYADDGWDSPQDRIRVNYSVETAEDGAGKKVSKLFAYVPVSVKVVDNGNMIDEVGVPADGGLPPASGVMDVVRRTSHKIPLSSICGISSNSLEYKYCGGCDYASRGMGCKFCKLSIPEYASERFEHSDVIEAVDITLHDEAERMKCFVGREGPGSPPARARISGGTLVEAGKETKDMILRLCGKIKAWRPNLPITLLICPPNRHSDMNDYKGAGVTEVYFNLELFDTGLAAEFMPGKSRISVSDYVSALRYAINLWPKPGSVKSALIAGLETEESTLEGVKVLASIGVRPVLQAFTPVDGTELEYIMPPDSETLYNLFLKASAICRECGTALGPSDLFDQGDNLSIPAELERRSRRLSP